MLLVNFLYKTNRQSMLNCRRRLLPSQGKWRVLKGRLRTLEAQYHYSMHLMFMVKNNKITFFKNILLLKDNLLWVICPIPANFLAIDLFLLKNFCSPKKSKHMIIFSRINPRRTMTNISPIPGNC